jgi:hypothetical protein
MNEVQRDAEFNRTHTGWYELYLQDRMSRDTYEFDYEGDEDERGTERPEGET